MPPIYPSTALKNQQREIKALADTQMVYITENGRGKYIFASVKVVEDAIAQAVEDALYEQRLAAALGQSRDGYERGDYYRLREELMAAVQRKRESHGEA